VIYGGEARSLESILGIAPYGAAWFVSKVEAKATPRQELEALGTTKLRDIAVVSEGVEGLRDKYDASGSIALKEYTPNYLKYEYSAPEVSLAVFSEIYFPEGWSVKIDGREAEYFAVDYILRGVELPAGEHTVEWYFRAPAWRATSLIMGIASVVILLGCIAVAARAIYKNIK